MNSERTTWHPPQTGKVASVPPFAPLAVAPFVYVDMKGLTVKCRTTYTTNHLDSSHPQGSYEIGDELLVVHLYGTNYPVVIPLCPVAG